MEHAAAVAAAAPQTAAAAAGAAAESWYLVKQLDRALSVTELLRLTQQHGMLLQPEHLTMALCTLERMLLRKETGGNSGRELCRGQSRVMLVTAGSQVTTVELLRAAMYLLPSHQRVAFASLESLEEDGPLPSPVGFSDTMCVPS